MGKHQGRRCCEEVPIAPSHSILLPAFGQTVPLPGLVRIPENLISFFDSPVHFSNLQIT